MTRWTQAQDEFLRSCVDEGVPYPAIALLVGRTAASVRCRVYRLYATAPRKRQWSAMAIRDAMRLREAGLRLSEIGDEFGVTASSVAKVLARYRS